MTNKKGFSLKAALLCCFFFGYYVCFAQKKIEGIIKANTNDTVKLLGYNGLSEVELATTVTDASGHFALQYPASQTGLGILRITKKGELLIALTDAEIEFSCNSINDVDHLVFIKGRENQVIHQYLLQEKEKSSVMEALTYLNNKYAADSLLNARTDFRESLKKEIDWFSNIDSVLYDKLTARSYFYWYFKTRENLAALGGEVNNPTGKLDAAIKKIDAIDFSDKRYWSSGLLKNIIYLHLQGLTKLYNSNEKYNYNLAVQKLIDHIIIDLQNKNMPLLNSITGYMFNYFEQNSLYDNSEYLSLKILALDDCNKCTIGENTDHPDTSLLKRLEQYKLLKPGLTAPDIAFNGKVKNVRSLKNVDSKYKLLVFGASWCPMCKQEVPQLSNAYAELQKKGVEIIFISLDKNSKEYAEFIKDFKFISYCDFNAWQSKPVIDYHIYSTPTMYLLNKDLTILFKPASLSQLNDFFTRN